jgi:hypothetical protein
LGNNNHRAGNSGEATTQWQGERLYRDGRGVGARYGKTVIIRAGHPASALAGDLPGIADRRRDKVQPVDLLEVSAETLAQALTRELDSHMIRQSQIDHAEGVEDGRQLVRIDFGFERHQRATADIEPMPNQAAGEVEPRIVEIHVRLSLL